MLDVRRMRVLREVAAKGSFSAAAESLAFTQSAVSQHIAALERETGAQLVQRNGRSIRLTDAGEALVSHADAVLARLSDAEEELAAIAGLRGGKLRLATFPSAGAALVPHAIALFRERHPEIELVLGEAEPDESLPSLRGGDCDLAVIFEYKTVHRELNGDFELVHLLDDRMHAALPKGHPLTAKKRLRMADLEGENWIGGTDRACAALLQQWCTAAGFEPNVAFESNDYAVIQGMVAAGVGIVLLPDLVLATGVNPGVEIRSLGKDAPIRVISAAVPTDGYRSGAVEAMLDVLKTVGERFDAERPQVSAAA
jgi:DNA-binding transcriptional LysR family regulator